MKPGGLERDRIGRETRQSIRNQEGRGRRAGPVQACTQRLHSALDSAVLNGEAILLRPDDTPTLTTGLVQGTPLNPCPNSLKVPLKRGKGLEIGTGLKRDVPIECFSTEGNGTTGHLGQGVKRPSAGVDSRQAAVCRELATSAEDYGQRQGRLVDSVPYQNDIFGCG
jgi:hypothetical protein